MTYGNCRVTILDEDGRPQVAGLKEDDLWYFPAGLPHSLQGIGPDGCEFVLAFDNGESSEINTLLVTDWLAHTPPEVLAKNFDVTEEALKNIPLHNKWIYKAAPAMLSFAIVPCIVVLPFCVLHNCLVALSLFFRARRNVRIDRRESAPVAAHRVRQRPRPRYECV